MVVSPAVTMVAGMGAVEKAAVVMVA